MSQFDFENYIKSIVDEHIDISQLAMDVCDEITISEEMIQAGVEGYLDEDKIIDLLDMDSLADNVYERISISDVADDVASGYMDMFIDNLNYDDIAGNVENAIDYDKIVETIIKNDHFLTAINGIITNSTTKTDPIVEEKTFTEGPYNGLEDAKDVHVFMNFTQEQLKDVIVSSIAGMMHVSRNNQIETLRTDVLYDAIVSTLPYEIKQFLNRKDK